MLVSLLFNKRIFDIVIAFKAVVTAPESVDVSFSTVTLNLLDNEIWPVFDIFAVRLTVLFCSVTVGLITIPENGFITVEFVLVHLIAVPLIPTLIMLRSETTLLRSELSFLIKLAVRLL